MDLLTFAFLAVLAAPSISLTTTKADPPVVTGTVIVAAPAGVVWERLADVDGWDALLEDIEKLQVLSHEGNEWRLKLHTKSMKRCGPHEYRLSLDPEGKTATLVLDDDRVQAKMTFAVEQTDDGSSRITHAMSTRVLGVFAWMVTDRALTTSTEACVRGYLADLAAAVERP